MSLRRSLRRIGLVLAAWSAAGAALPALAGEMQVQGRIIDVVPISEAGSHGRAACQPPRPDRRDDLAALLEWDLRTRCASSPASGPAGARAVSGYRVYYRWDGRTYQHVVRQPPVGDTISLRVRVN